MRILVTGANGFLGSFITKKLCDDGFEVVAMDLSNNNIDDRATYIKASYLDERTDWYEFLKRPDVCLHAAWRDGFKHNSQLHILELSSHYNFLCKLIDSGIKQICVMGSMHEIGYHEGVVDENTPCNPLSLYGIAKNSLRQALEVYTKDKKVIFQWIRGFYIYSDSMLSHSIFSKILIADTEGKAFFPFTSGKNKFDFISIDEITKQICAVITQNDENGIINCCSGVPVSLAEEIEDFIKINRLKIKLDYGKFPDRAYDSPCIYGDNTKINKILRKKDNL